MIKRNIIKMLKKALDDATVSNASSSDFDNAVMTAVCVNVLIKNKIIKAKSIFSKLKKEEVDDFKKVWDNANGIYPSVKDAVSGFFNEAESNFIKPQLHKVKPIKRRIV